MAGSYLEATGLTLRAARPADRDPGGTVSGTGVRMLSRVTAWVIAGAAVLAGAGWAALRAPVTPIGVVYAL